MSALTKIFGTHSDRELKRITPLVDKVESYRDEMKALSDEELRGKTKEYKERLEKGETLDDLLPEAYAWSITEYRLSVVLSCIRDVLQR